MPNSIKKIDYIFCRETGRDLFFRNLTSSPLGGIEIVDQQLVSFDKDPVVNFYIFVPSGEDARYFYRYLGRELYEQLKGESDISAGSIRDGVFQSVLGLPGLNVDDPTILILQAREHEANRAEGILRELGEKEYLDERDHETFIFGSKEVDRNTFDHELENNFGGDFTSEALSEAKAELEGAIFHYNDSLVKKHINRINKETDESDLEDGRFEPKRLRINSELAKQLLEGLRESVEGTIAKGRERK